MNTNTKRAAASISAFAVTVGLVLGAFGIASAISPHNKGEEGTVVTVSTPTPTATPEPTSTLTPVVVETPAAPVEEAPVIEAPAEPAPEQPQQEQRAPEQAVEAPPVVEEPAPAPRPDPIRCPAGSMAVSSDGYNDTGCLPVECASGVVGDPANPRPECDAPFRP